VGHTLLLVLSHYGVLGASVRLTREAKHVGLIYMADRWAWLPLALRAMPGAYGGKPSMTLVMPCMIPGMILEWLLPHIFGSISTRAPGTSPFTVFLK
jgi:hypothetical protein